MPRQDQRICRVPDCGRPLQGRGLCGTHLDRARRHDGDPLADVPIQKKGNGDPDAATRRCPKCERFLPADDFRMRSGKQSRYRRAHCWQCESNYSARYREKNRTGADLAYWRSAIMRSYGLTEEDFEAILDGQNGCCAICGTTEPGANRTRFCVDHCHATGVVRGLLCNSCNRALAALGDSSDGVRRAFEYLERAERRAAVIRDGVDR